MKYLLAVLCVLLCTASSTSITNRWHPKKIATRHARLVYMAKIKEYKATPTQKKWDEVMTEYTNYYRVATNWYVYRNQSNAYLKAKYDARPKP